MAVGETVIWVRVLDRFWYESRDDKVIEDKTKGTRRQAKYLSSSEILGLRSYPIYSIPQNLSIRYPRTSSTNFFPLRHLVATPKISVHIPSMSDPHPPKRQTFAHYH